ncbi:MAG: DNA polymerase III subunit epsilon [Rhodospirillaceae bacterium]|nr:DNA polymerase III subunit epsilon [Rhodospirillaceae bacterium]
MTREIVLDTETTGIDPKDGHRIIEIGALEMDNHMPTGKQLHLYINPERDIDAGAVAIHGLTSEFLADKPVFADIVDEFLNFVGDSPMVIHNAPFDMGFVNAELARLARAPLPMTQAVDTLPMARKKFPGAQANLNALCRRFEIDNSHRDLHGALIDADLLAAVYVELLGGRQPGLSLEAASVQNDLAQNDLAQNNPARHAQGAGRPADSDMDNDAFSLRADSTRFERPHEPTPDERAAHAMLVARITDAIWSRS